MPRGPEPGNPATPLLSISVSSKAPVPPNPPQPPTNPAKKRTTHACDRCRQLRTKCSGKTPCVRCEKDGAQCLYGDHKREKDRKEFRQTVTRVGALEDQNRELVLQLRKLQSSDQLQPTQRQEIARVLDKYNKDVEEAESSNRSQSGTQSQKSPLSGTGTTVEEEEAGEDEERESDDDRETGGEGSARSRVVGSPGHQGELQRAVATTTVSGVSGFIGKMSEISWIQRSYEQLASRPEGVYGAGLVQIGPGTNATVNLRYPTDEFNLLKNDEDAFSAMQWPPYQVGLIVTEAYFHATRGAHQFLQRAKFLDSMAEFAYLKNPVTWERQRWLALANMVWAIGSKWLQMAKLAHLEGMENHLEYYARARTLGLDHRVLIDQPSIETVQGIGLLVFYLLINGSISRAWSVLANAHQQALSLGLHLKVSDPSINDIMQEERACIWYSLYKLQSLLTEMTGRPHLIRKIDTTVSLDKLDERLYDVYGPRGAPETAFGQEVKSLWHNFLEVSRDMDPNLVHTIIDVAGLDQSESFTARRLILYQVRLCHLSEEVASQLYTGMHDFAWAETQRKIEKFQEALNSWYDSLPKDLILTHGVGQGSDRRTQLELNMYFYSITMIVYRPCLCDIRIEDESIKSRDFNEASARTCVSTALKMLDLVAEQLASHQYWSLPWWTLLHYVCQAASVILLELSLGMQHVPRETASVETGMRTAMSCLSYMTVESRSAYKAWRTFQELLRMLDPRPERLEAFGATAQVIRPLSWSEEDEHLFLDELQPVPCVGWS